MMYHARQLALSALIPLFLTACGGSTADSTSTPNSPNIEDSGHNSTPNTPDIDDSGNYYVLSSASLISDGPANMDTYDLIESVLGVGSIEAPDLYGDDNHSGVKHITEDNDNQVGDYFRFTIHRDLDGDRDTGKTDRQRNEIKVYDKSKDSLKGFMDTTFEYRWKFRIDEDLAVTSHFTHLFQLKAVSDFGDPVSQPLVTITGNTKSGISGLEIRHVDSRDAKTMLLHTSQLDIDWASQIQGQWLEVFVRAKFSEQGSLEMTVTPLGSVVPLFSVSKQNIELWRSGSNGSTDNFVRPKWGIYRSLNDKAGLNAGEDEVWFADFEIKEVQRIAP